MRKLVILTTLVAGLAASVAAIPGVAAPQTVTVREKNFKIVLSAKPRAGQVRFVVINTSTLPHDFRLSGGGKTWKTPKLAGGGKATILATLKRGVRYPFWCSVSGHEKAGMLGSFVAR